MRFTFLLKLFSNMKIYTKYKKLFIFSLENKKVFDSTLVILTYKLFFTTHVIIFYCST